MLTNVFSCFILSPEAVFAASPLLSTRRAPLAATRRAAVDPPGLRTLLFCLPVPLTFRCTVTRLLKDHSAGSSRLSHWRIACPDIPPRFRFQRYPIIPFAMFLAPRRKKLPSAHTRSSLSVAQRRASNSTTGCKPNANSLPPPSYPIRQRNLPCPRHLWRMPVPPGKFLLGLAASRWCEPLTIAHRFSLYFFRA